MPKVACDGDVGRAWTSAATASAIARRPLLATELGVDPDPATQSVDLEPLRAR